MNTYCLWIFRKKKKLEKVRKQNLLEKLEIKEIKKKNFIFWNFKEQENET
jgi:hypothetical protein